MGEITLGFKVLEELNRYYILGKITAGILHEINNPLSNMAANSTMLEQLLAGSDDVDINDAKSMTAIMERSAQKICRITEDLKVFTGSYAKEVRPGQKEGSNLNTAIEKSAAILANKLKYTVKIDYVLNDIPPADCGEQELLQLILNILLLLFDMIGGKGTITVKTGLEEGSLRADFFSPDCPERPFVSDLHETAIYVSQKIAERNRGRLTVDAGTNSPAQFRIILPAAHNQE